jgi:hypothetical protein
MNPTTTKESDFLFLWKMKARHGDNNDDDDERCASLAMTVESDEGSDSLDVHPTDPKQSSFPVRRSTCSFFGQQEVPMTDPDIYGQRHPIEGEELVQFKLREFDLAVAAIPPKSRQTVDTAETRCPQLLTNRFKLMFLRCDCFNAAVSFFLLIVQKKKRIGSVLLHTSMQPVLTSVSE